MDLQQRLEELEIRIAHQEYALQTQGEELLYLQRQNIELLRRVETLSERLQALGSPPVTDGRNEPPPPHY